VEKRLPKRPANLLALARVRAKTPSCQSPVVERRPDNPGPFDELVARGYLTSEGSVTQEGWEYPLK
jgi:hypothetical protein